MKTTENDRTRELRRVVNRSISELFLDEVHGGATCSVILREDRAHAEYFGTGDKRNKILAIEVVRWFRDLPWMDYLVLTIPWTETIGIKRGDVALFIDKPVAGEIPLENLAHDPALWTRFLERFDTPIGRAGLALDFRRAHARRGEATLNETPEDL